METRNPTAAAAGHEVHLLPHSHPDPDIWNALITQQKTIRLQALQTSPESFSSNYEREAAFTDQEWDARLTKPEAHTFVAVFQTKDAAAGVEAVANRDWCGNVVLIGSAAHGAAARDRCAMRLNTQEECTMFEICGLYVIPSTRGHGIGRALMLAAIGHGKLLAKEQGRQKVVIRVSASRKNTGAVSLYESLGFKARDALDSVAGEKVELTLRSSV